jgi:hypothetical protein
VISVLALSFSSFLSGKDINRRSIPRPIQKVPQLSKVGDGNYRNIKIVFDQKTGNFIFTWQVMSEFNKKWEKYSYVKEPRNKLDLIVESSVTQCFANGTSKFVYEYVITNNKTSNQALDGFMIQIFDNILNTSLKELWLGEKVDQPVPGGTWKVWSPLPREIASPGKTLTIRFESTGLPRVTNCYAEGAIKIRTEKSSEEKPDSILIALSELKKTNGILSQTIGPFKVENNVHPVKFIRDIIGMMDVCLKMGWIDDPNTLNILKQSLDKIRILIESKEFEKAITEMRYVITLVEKGLNKTVTSEVYAIVKYNLEYLLQIVK